MQFRNPRNLIPFDAIGAFLTATITAFILAPNLLNTGLPRPILIVLAAIAALYGVFGLCGLVARIETVKMLKTLAVLNLLYGVATIAVCLIYRNELTFVGAVYFPAESLILFALAAFEWRVAQRKDEKISLKDAN